MRDTHDAFQKQLAFGRLAESQIGVWLRRVKGYTVLPAYDIEYQTGKGPRLFTPESELVSPDLLIMRGDAVRWIECKHKSVFTWYRKSPRDDKWQTGIDAHHFEQYQIVAKHSPFPIWVLFLHASAACKPYNGNRPSPTGLYGAMLPTLTRCGEKRFDTSQQRWLYYWHKDDLRLIATLEEVQAATEQKGRPTP